MRTMFSRFLLFCSRSFEQALVFWGAVLEGVRIIALALLRFAKYGVVKGSVLAILMGGLIVACRTKLAERDKADDRLKF